MAESRIIKRNVLFWGKSGLQLTGMMLIFMVVYGFLFNMGSGSIFGDFWKTAYFYGGIISVLFALIGPVAYVGVIFRWHCLLDQEEGKQSLGHRFSA